MQRSPGCTVTGSVPVFTYASRLPVASQPAGVLAAVGYTGYLAPVPPPIVSITSRIMLFSPPCCISCLVYSGVSLLREFYTVIQVALSSSR